MLPFPCLGLPDLASCKIFRDGVLERLDKESIQFYYHKLAQNRVYASKNNTVPSSCEAQNCKVSVLIFIEVISALISASVDITSCKSETIGNRFGCLCMHECLCALYMHAHAYVSVLLF